MKYPFAYRRLRDALLHEQVSAVCAGSAYKEIAARLARDATADIPARPYLDERVYAARRDNGREAIEGAIAVTAALTRIDGALCLTPDLVTAGFGCVIGLDDADPTLHVTSAPTPTRQQLIRVDAQAYGTRHRSVFRYCSAVPGAVAFVVSQDGHVRAVTRIGQMLTMWDNIRLSMTS